jgi:beta-lactam-binding protein with PASTA domain
MEAAAVEQELAAAGLRAGTVREATTTDALAGRVAHQTPAAGRQVAPGSAVDVTVSSGPPA